MRVACRLRMLRGQRTLEDIATAVGISRGLLSEIERGIRFPADKHVVALENAYGADAADWYPNVDAPVQTLSLVRDDEDS